MKYRKTAAVLLALAMTASLAACGTAKTATASDDTATETPAAVTSTANAVTDVAAESTDLYTDRDLTQSPDLTDAKTLTVADGDTLTVSDEGVYVLTGTAANAQIVVEAPDDAKVQLVLDALTVTNDDAPVIYVKNADKVFVTTASGTDNTLAVTGTFTADGDTNTDAVIFSKDDLVLNGLGTLKIASTDNGVTSKDDLKVTGGTYAIDCASHGLEANDGAYVCGGTLSITAGECIEATCVRIDGGSLDLYGTDDGINAAYQSDDAAVPCIEITGGEISITMAQGDTDALDSNGSLIISGGTVTISAQFAFDFVTGAEHTGGTITVNGETVSEITESMMTGGGMGGMGQMGGPGQMPGGMGGHGHP